MAVEKSLVDRLVRNIMRRSIDSKVAGTLNFKPIKARIGSPIITERDYAIDPPEQEVLVTKVSAR